MTSNTSYRCVFRCLLLNDLFSQKIANEVHNGEESSDNIKYQWEDELVVSEIQEHTVIKSGTYILMGSHGTLGDFSFAIENMTLFTLNSKTGNITQFAFSKELVSDMQVVEDEDGLLVTIELKDNEPFINPIPGIYITNRDFPNALKEHA